MNHQQLHRFLQSNHPSIVLVHLYELGQLQEFARMHTTPQDVEHHPEGTVFAHTLLVVDYAAYIAKRDQLSYIDKAILMLAALLHDTGKMTHTQVNESTGKITSYGHAEASGVFAKQFLSTMGITGVYQDTIVHLVEEHMVHYLLPTITPKNVAKLARRLFPATIPMLALLVEADVFGRGCAPKATALHTIHTIVQYAQSIHAPEDVQQPKPYITGTHILAHLSVTGKRIGEIKSEMYALQCAGRFTDADEALQYLLLTYM